MRYAITNRRHLTGMKTRAVLVGGLAARGGPSREMYDEDFDEGMSVATGALREEREGWRRPRLGGRLTIAAAHASLVLVAATMLPAMLDRLSTLHAESA